MRRKGNFVRHTADELAKLESETDWAKVGATTREEIERQAEADDGPLPKAGRTPSYWGFPVLNEASISVWILTYWTGSRRQAPDTRRASTPCCVPSCTRGAVPTCPPGNLNKKLGSGLATLRKLRGLLPSRGRPVEDCRAAPVLL